MRGSKNEFPPQTGRYAVKVKNGAGWRTHNTARLQISVGQPYHEGDKLAATLNWVRHRFDHVVICVNDSLQRFNHQYEEGLSEDEAFAKAHDAGTAWIARNRELIDALPSVELHRWEDWKARSDFEDTMQTTLAFYDSNREFREAITASIAARWKRWSVSDGLSGQYRFADFAANARTYLLEETAVFSLMFKTDNAVDVYPGSVLLPCVLFQGRKVEGAPEGLDLGTFTRIDFARNKWFARHNPVERHATPRHA